MERIDERTYKFALRVVKLVNSLPLDTTGSVLGKQVLRSATSIGANIEEAYAAVSQKEFSLKMSIALKEARETHYWLRLIQDTELVTPNRIDPLIQESLEIKLILGKTVFTSKKLKSKNNA